MSNKIIVNDDNTVVFHYDGVKLQTIKENFPKDLVWYLLKVLPALEHAKDEILKDVRNVIGDAEPAEALKLCKAKGMLV